MEEIKIDLPVCNQRELSDNWAAQYGCAICSLWMLIKLHDPNFKLSPIELVKMCLERDGFLENIGWKHAAIVDLGNHFGLNLTYAKKFFYTLEEKEAGLEIINNNLRRNQPVIASVYSHLNPARSGHMVVIQGVRIFNDKVIGYDIQDPNPEFRGHNYFLTKEEFVNGWRGGMIYVKFPLQN